MKTRSLGGHMGMLTGAAVAAAALAGLAPGVAWSQLRVATWNITRYEGGRVADIQNTVYGQFDPPGAAPVQQFIPDIILAQEIFGASGSSGAGPAAAPGPGISAFVNALNSVPGGPTDWVAAPFLLNSVNHSSSNSPPSMFYRSSKVELVFPVTRLTTGTGSCDTCPPRDTLRYRVRLIGYPEATAAQTDIFLYNSHYKAGSTTTDQTRRAPEAQRIRNDIEALSFAFPQAHIIHGGDFNTQSSSQQNMQILLGSNDLNQIFDPINRLGSWNNSGAFSLVHTQDPAGGGGMDDRLDILFVSAALRDGAGLDYNGSATAPYSSSTWNDPNHSYRAWGNDGTSFNTALRTVNNSFVGQGIAQSIINTATTAGGHIPVYLDLRLPARMLAQGVIDLGDVPQGSPATALIQVANTDPQLLERYSRNGQFAAFQALSASIDQYPAGFSGPSGPFVVVAGAPVTRQVTLDTSEPGFKSGVIVINGNGVPSSLAVQVVANVTPVGPAPCSPVDIADSSGLSAVNGGGPDGLIDDNDIAAFLVALTFAEADPSVVPVIDIADAVGLSRHDGGGPDGVVDGNDVIAFLNLFAAGCAETIRPATERGIDAAGQGIRF